ncbi:MAG: hypothetical protein ACK5W1_04280 [Flavobacteriales bacterium]
MALIEQMVNTLNAYEVADFKDFLSRKRNQAVQMQLLEHIAQNPKALAADRMLALYGTDKRSAYKSCQSRLTSNFVQYILSRNEDDSELTHEALPHLAVARFMIRKGAYKIAAEFLNRAEEEAIGARQYELLETVYTWQMQHVMEMELNAQDIHQKWQKNRARHDAMVNLNFTFAEVARKHAQARLRGQILNKELIIKETYEKVRPAVEQANDPAYMHRLFSLIRNVATSNKAYKEFERLVSNVYGRLKGKNCFLPGDSEYELGFLYMIAHAQYRNARFEAALETLTTAQKLREKLTILPPKITYKLIALHASILNGAGNVTEAIPMIEKCLNQRGKYDEDTELLNMQLSLAAYLYNAREYKRAVKVLNTFPYDKAQLTRMMGTEWRFKLEMFELISFYDRGLVDEALTHLQRIRPYYKDFFREEEYARVEVYLGFVERMLLDPQCVTTDAFRQDVKIAQLNRRNEEEDIQAIAFHCWLSSKIFQRDYYEVLLEAIGWKREVEVLESGD